MQSDDGPSSDPAAVITPPPPPRPPASPLPGLPNGITVESTIEEDIAFMAARMERSVTPRRDVISIANQTESGRAMIAELQRQLHAEERDRTPARLPITPVSGGENDKVNRMLQFADDPEKDARRSERQYDWSQEFDRPVDRPRSIFAMHEDLGGLKFKPAACNDTLTEPGPNDSNLHNKGLQMHLKMVYGDSIWDESKGRSDHALPWFDDVLSLATAANVSFPLILHKRLGPQGQRWLISLLPDKTYHDWASENFRLLRIAFRTRFTNQTRSDRALAFEQITLRGVFQNGSSLSKYAESFIFLCRQVGPELMPDAAACLHFLKGMDAVLRAECMITPLGFEWECMSDLVRFAVLQERRLLIRHQCSQTQTPSPHRPPFSGPKQRVQGGSRWRPSSAAAAAAAAGGDDPEPDLPDAVPAGFNKLSYPPPPMAAAARITPSKLEGNIKTCPCYGWGLDLTTAAPFQLLDPTIPGLPVSVKNVLWDWGICFNCRGTWETGRHMAKRCGAGGLHAPNKRAAYNQPYGTDTDPAQKRVRFTR